MTFATGKRQYLKIKRWNKLLKHIATPSIGVAFSAWLARQQLEEQGYERHYTRTGISGRHYQPDGG
ncbi:hypothetical protein THOD04_120081 [Vibrio owensii]|nr:hypothetical protein THOD04_120081 [Vibrio owensii]